MHGKHLTALPQPSMHCILLRTQHPMDHDLPCHHMPFHAKNLFTVISSKPIKNTTDYRLYYVSAAQTPA